MSDDPILDLTHIDLDSPTGEVELFVAQEGLHAKLEADIAAMTRIVDDFNAWIDNSLDAVCRAHYDARFDPWVLRWATSLFLAETATRVDPGPKQGASGGAPAR